jgi:hypothetical protein
MVSLTGIIMVAIGTTKIIRIIARVVISSEIVVAIKTVTAAIRVTMMAITVMGIIEQLVKLNLPRSTRNMV